MSSQDFRMARMRSRRLALVRGFKRRLVFRRLSTMSAASPKGHADGGKVVAHGFRVIVRLSTFGPLEPVDSRRISFAPTLSAALLLIDFHVVQLPVLLNGISFATTLPLTYSCNGRLPCAKA